MCDKCVQWGGHTWHSYGGYYYERGKHGNVKRLHREKYIAEVGPIPDGYHVHHKDENILNNDISNLETLSPEDHARKHPKTGPFLPREVLAERFKAKWAVAEWKDLTCAQCGAAFQSRAWHMATPFCSIPCQDKWRDNAFAGEQRTCEQCSAAYWATKSTQKYCGRTCNQRAAMARTRCEPSRLQCAHCGTDFLAGRSNARFCSRDCAVSYHARNKQRRKVSSLRPSV